MRYLLRRARPFLISVCNIVGLPCSMVGVVLLFRYALPEAPPGGEATQKVREALPGWEAEVQRYNTFWSFSGRLWKQSHPSALHGGVGAASPAPLRSTPVTRECYPMRCAVSKP
jgi:hypothetical protein